MTTGEITLRTTGDQPIITHYDQRIAVSDCVVDRLLSGAGIIRIRAANGELIYRLGQHHSPGSYWDAELVYEDIREVS